MPGPHAVFAALAVAALVGSAGSSRAATATFGFEDLPIGSETPLSSTISGVTASFSSPSGSDPGAFAVSYNSSSGPFGSPYRTLTGAFLTVGPASGATGSALRIAFNTAVTSITLLFALDDPASTTVFSLSTSAGGAAAGSGTLAAGFRYPEGTLLFSGIPFTSVTLSSNALDFQVDDITVTTATVPEPASLAVLAAGLAIAAVTRRRSA